LKYKWYDGIWATSGTGQMPVSSALTAGKGYIAMYGLFLKHTDSIKFRRKYKADKYYEIARKVVSDYARSEFF